MIKIQQHTISKHSAGYEMFWVECSIKLNFQPLENRIFYIFAINFYKIQIWNSEHALFNNL